MTMIELVITNEESWIEEINEDVPQEKSDLAVIKMRWRCYPDALTTTQTSYLYGKADYESMKKLMKCNWAPYLINWTQKKNGKFSATSLKNQSKHTFPRRNVNQAELTDQNGWTNKSWERYGKNPEHIKSGEAWKLIHLMKPMHGLETMGNSQGCENIWGKYCIESKGYPQTLLEYCKLKANS